MSPHSSLPDLFLRRVIRETGSVSSLKLQTLKCPQCYPEPTLAVLVTLLLLCCLTLGPRLLIEESIGFSVSEGEPMTIMVKSVAAAAVSSQVGRQDAGAVADSLCVETTTTKQRERAT